MNLSEIKQVLGAEKIQLTKSLGQNFLHDANQIHRIITAAELSPNDQVLEIGPGLGALTQPLLGQVPHVLALEKDKRLYDSLKRRIGHERGLTLLHEDALEYLHRQRADWSFWKLVSNLPYSVASPILVELAKSERAPARLAVTLQLEVAARVAASAGEKDYGVLSLLVQLQYQARSMFKIPASCFFPVPEIDSACLTLVRRSTPLLMPQSFRAFEKIIKRGFSQRRKMMIKLLKSDWPILQLERAYAELGLSEKARAETVTLDQYVRLTELMTLQDPKKADHGHRRNL